MTVVDHLSSSRSITHSAESGCGATCQSSQTLRPNFAITVVVWLHLQNTNGPALRPFDTGSRTIPYVCYVFDQHSPKMAGLKEKKPKMAIRQVETVHITV